MDDGTCPLCTEELDPTDCLLASRLCQCRFSVCLWCFRRITEDAAKDSRPALCPNCREPYDIERITREGRELHPQQLEEVKRKKGKTEEKKKPAAASRPRRDLANVRVVQRNLVYVVGLPMDTCYEDTLLSADYIGQFGKIVKISVSRSGPYGSVAAKNGPTGSAYITFKRTEDARRCIESIHGTTWEGKLVKACYGTTKYCNAFLKGLPCNNGECLYLHDVAAEEDSYTKEETKSTKFVNLVHAASLNQASAVASGQPHGTTSGDLSAAMSGLTQSAAADSELPSTLDDEHSDGSSWPSLQSNAWVAKAASMPAQAVPPAEDAQAWPGLPGNRSCTGTGNSSSAEASENESEQVAGKPPLGKFGATMADKIARASSSPAASKAESSKKKLTPLSRRIKAAEGLQEGKPAGGKDRPSPPRTPQPVQKQAQESAPAPSGQEDRSSSDEQPEASLASQEPSKQAAERRQEAPAAAFKAPPGFSGPSSRQKAVKAPPGFAGVGHESGSRLGSPYQSFGSDTSSPAPQAGLLGEAGAGPSQSSSLQSIWGSYGSLDAAGLPRTVQGPPPGYDWQPLPPPRSRSRFQFANSEDPTDSVPQTAPPHSMQLEQPATPNITHGLYGDPGAYGGLFSQSPFSSSGSIPAVYQTFPGSCEWNADNCNGNHAADGNGRLPAGLLLLRKLQAKGGVAPRNTAASGAHQPQHGIFQDPAILSAKPTTERGA